MTAATQLRQAGVRLRRQDVPAARLNAAIEFYHDGWPCQRLAERHGCDTETVRQALKRAGIRLRSPCERHWPRAFIEVDLGCDTRPVNTRKCLLSAVGIVVAAAMIDRVARHVASEG